MSNVPTTPTAAELEILKALWELGPSSVRAVYQHLGQSRDWAYNTVQTLLRIMEGKKKLVRHHVEGRTFIYTPCYSRDESACRFLERVFDGAAAELVQSLLRSEKISAAELEQLQLMIAKARQPERREPPSGEHP